MNTRAYSYDVMIVLVAGFQVVGGEYSGRADLSTIISSITPGGPADLDGCIKPGRVAFCDPVHPVWV